MTLNRRKLNIGLIILACILASATAIVAWLPQRHAAAQRDVAAVVASGDEMADSSQLAVAADTSHTAAPVETQPRQVACIEAVAPQRELPRAPQATQLPEADVRLMGSGHPFAAEAAKVLSGRLSVGDSASRRQILNYCEHLRTAYTTRDLDFIRQIYSDKALIIVGHTVRTSAKPGAATGNERVRYLLHTKQQYVDRLARIFAANRDIDVRFSDFTIMRHPTRPDIYGVTLRQLYRSDTYADEGWLFLLWDFSNPSMPLIHVRTWQPHQYVDGDDDIIGLSDFNFE